MNPPEKFKDQIRVVGVSGSLRRGSYTDIVVKKALQGATDAGADSTFINLRKFELPFYGMVPDKDFPPDVFRLREIIKQSHGVVLGTPEYHSSISGVLKNFLDFMRFEEFEGKMVGLVGVSGGNLGATNALNSLRTIGRCLHAWVLPQQVSVPQVHKQFDKQGQFLDEAIEKRLFEIGGQVAKLANSHAMQKDQDFIKMWEALPLNPGGEKY